MKTAVQRIFFLFLSFLFSLYGRQVNSQVFTEPMRVNPAQYDYYRFSDVPLAKRGYLQKTTSIDTAAVPFFDDFSGKDISWAPSRNFFGQEIRTIRFLNAKDAHAFGGMGLNIKTTSRGSVWENIGTDPTIEFTSVSYPETSKLWVCGKNGWMANSINNGVTFNPIISPSDTVSLVSISFNSFDIGAVVDSIGKIFITNNTGQTWIPSTFTGGRFHANSIFWLQGSNRILAVGDSAKTAISIDGGINFQVSLNPTGKNKNFHKVMVLDGYLGFAVGDSGLIYKTLDGGNSWYPTYNSGIESLRDIDVNPANTDLIWAVGDGGTLLYSQTKGESWASLRSGTTDDLLSIALVNEFRGWIGTSKGRLLQVVYDPLRPMSKWWEPNSGVYVNNTFTTDQITVGVATFDGLNQQGIPYSLVPKKEGPCDTLTSAFFDLQQFFGNPGTPLFLSFYLQPGTKFPQVIPDNIDSLVLQFKSGKGKWISVWNREGVRDNLLQAPFHYSAVTIPDSMKYDGFRFRFINFGNQNGNYDIWNLDYVRLDGEHDENDSLAQDYAMGKPFGRLLKDFSALPMEQFRYVLQNSPDMFRESVVGQAINLNASATNLRGFFYLNRAIPDNVERLITLPNGNIAGLQSPFFPGISKVDVSIRVSDFKSAIKTDQYATFQYGVGLDNDEFTNKYLTNDTVLGSFNASTAMAYDDGSGELIRGIGGNNAIGVVKYYLPVSDTLTDIQLFFGRTPENLEQSINFTLLVYDSINVTANYPPENALPLIRKLVILPPSDSINKFISFSIREASATQKRILTGGRHFYIGWQQGSIDNGNEVRIGCDVNSSNKGSLLFRSLQTWRVWEFDDYPLMIRPIFGPEVTTSVRSSLSKPLSPFYPNPAKDAIRNQFDFNHLQVYNTMGQLVGETESGRSGDLVPLHLPKGIYSLKWLERGGSWVSQRLIID